MFCPECGNEVTDGEVFCSKCGTKLIDDNTTPQEIDTPDRQASDVAENTKVVHQNAVKTRKLQKFAKYGRALMYISVAILFLSSFIHLPIPISPKILALGAVLGVFISALGLKRPLEFSRIMELIGASIVMVIIVVVSLGSGGNDKYIQMVKNGIFEAYPQKTIGEAFDGYLGKPKWESGISEDGVKFVNVTGKIYYYDKETDILVQFVIENEKTGSFSYNACELNGVPQTDLFFWGLLEAIYNDDESSSAKDLPDYVPGINSIMIGETRSISVYDGEEMEVTLDNIEFTDGPLPTEYNSYYYYHTPDDGFTYLVATFTVRNTGTKNAGLYTAWSTVIYNGKYEYKDEFTLGDDLTDLAPLSNPRTGSVAFMVPKLVAESEDALVINISTGVGEDNISYVIRRGNGMPSGSGMKGEASEIVSMYRGSWSGRDYERIYMEIDYMDANGGYFDILINWSDSASEWLQWELLGTYEEGGIHYYGNLLECYGSDGEIEKNVVSDVEEGFLWTDDDGLLYWDDFMEPAGETYVLEKVTY